MAFVREKKMRVNGKEYGGYYQLVEGYREDGKVKQRLVKYLGKFDSRAEAMEAAFGHNAVEEKEPQYIRRLRELDAEYRRNIAPSGHFKDAEKVASRMQKTAEAVSKTNRKYGWDSAEYAAAMKAHKPNQERWRELETRYFNKAWDARAKADAIYDRLSPRQQERARGLSLSVIENILRNRDKVARMAPLIEDGFYNF